MFISVFSVRDSMFTTIDDLLNVWAYDLWVTFSRPYRNEEIEQTSLQIPGVMDAESVGFTTTRRVRDDDSESDSVMLFAMKPGSTLLNPVMVSGRWLLPGDENGVVVTTEFLKLEKDVAVGDDIVLDIKGREHTWQVVGVTQMVWSGAYVNYPHFARVKREAGRANMVWVVTEQHDLAYQTARARQLEQHYERQGLRVSSVAKIAEERVEVETIFAAIVMLLVIMAVLLAVVGGLGLMGTMSINVLERTREIGIMRSIGASNHAILNLVMVEGITIGLMSWLLSGAFALLLSKPLSNLVGMALFQIPLSYVFSVSGVIIWLAMVVLLSALASALPAWNASRLTVRDVLAYE